MTFTRAIIAIILPGVMVTAPLSAQDASGDVEPEAEQSTVPTTAPIIVTGKQEDQKQVLVGSRIAKKPTVNFTGIATNTGTRGLVPQSGMDPGANIRLIKNTTCSSDDAQISAKAACILIEADAAYAKGDVPGAQNLLSFLTYTHDFTPYEQLSGAKRQYQIANDLKNNASRETALEQMLETGAMGNAEAMSARRALISMALKDGRRSLARNRLVELDHLGGANAQRLANLAILTRELDLADANIFMLRAIAAREDAGSDVPRGWRDFVNTDDSAKQ